jgi:hypothetical protein
MNSRILLPALGGGTIIVSILEPLLSSPSTIIYPLGGLEVIIQIHLLSSYFFLIYIYLGSPSTCGLQPNYGPTYSRGTHYRFV